jgi:hypothetical protein
LGKGFGKYDGGVLRIRDVGVPGVEFAKGNGIAVAADGEDAGVLFGSGEVPGNESAEEEKEREKDEGQGRLAKKSGHVLIGPEMRKEVTGEGRKDRKLNHRTLNIEQLNPDKRNRDFADSASNLEQSNNE